MNQLREEIQELVKDKYNVEWVAEIKHKFSPKGLNDLFTFIQLDLEGKLDRVTFPDAVYSELLGQAIENEEQVIRDHLYEDWSLDESYTLNDTELGLRLNINHHLIDDMIAYIRNKYPDKEYTPDETVNIIYDAIYKFRWDIYPYLRSDVEEFLGIELDDNEVYDRLFYHNIYGELYECDYNPNIAIKVGLTPFEYDDEDFGTRYFVALSGTGMDLSPRYEAYFTLLWEYLPRDAQYVPDEKNWEWYSYVVGKHIADEVKDIVSLKKPIIKVEMRRKGE